MRSAPQERRNERVFRLQAGSACLSRPDESAALVVEKVDMEPRIALLPLQSVQGERWKRERNDHALYGWHPQECQALCGAERLHHDPRKVCRLRIARFDPVPQFRQARGDGISNQEEIE